ncbi:MAG: metallophosphoesterase [Ruminiclostridium sp.]|nr:metallophosphoesterase [Ruminiclostridium sp.]
MKWYIIAPATLLVILIYMFLQALSFKIRFFTLPSKANIRFFHLTDVHIRRLFISAKRIKKAIEKTNPDYILISGDLLEKPEDLNKLEKWLKNINIKIPVYAVLGNHEHKCFREHPSFKNKFSGVMKELNIKVLNNDVVILNKKNGLNPTDNGGLNSLDNNSLKTSDKNGLNLSYNNGLKSLDKNGQNLSYNNGLKSSGKNGQKPLDKNNSVALIGIRDCKAGNLIDNQILLDLRKQYECVIAFSHSPDISLLIPENTVDILIVGHLHGGQIWLPFNLEYLILRKDNLSKMGYYKGFATIRGNRIYISRGLGTVLFPFRFLSIPEVTVFDA